MQVIAIDKYVPHRKAMSLQVGWYPYLGSIVGEGVSVDLGDDVWFSRQLPLRGAACWLVCTP